jgi:hypothetical protein
MQYGFVKTIVDALYGALSSFWTCGNHPKHLAYISLSDNCNHCLVAWHPLSFSIFLGIPGPSGRNSPPKITGITIECGPYGKNPQEDSFQRLLVEQPTLQELTPHLNDAFTSQRPHQLFTTIVDRGSSRSDMEKGTTTKIIHNATQDNDVTSQRVDTVLMADSSDVPAVSESSVSPNNTTVMADLNIIEDVCLYVQRQQKTFNDPMQKSPCIRLFRDEAEFKLFLNNAHSSGKQPNRIDSLKDTLTKCRDDPLEMPQVQILKLARFLAAATLQFHSTPWAKHGFTSSDIFLLAPHNSLPDSQPEPYLCAPFSKAAPNVPSTQESPNSRSLVANEALFRLGVCLLELAFKRPLRDLREPEDMVDGQANEYTDYFVSKRLANRVSNHMGVGYGKVVYECLNGDFGLGESPSLESVELQTAFFEQVLCELDKCFYSFMDR